MTDLDDMDALAAEYVLGSLDAAERAHVERRRQVNLSLDRAIVEWEQRLAPLNGAMPSIAPPPAVKSEIMGRLFKAQSLSAQIGDRPSADIHTLQRRVARWRSAALLTGAIAASLVGVIGYRETVRQVAPQGSYVAVLQKDAQSPAFLMTVDIGARTLTVRPVAAQAQAGHSYELWLISEHVGAPRSLGVVSDRQRATAAQLAAYQPGDIETATYAITLEAEGGSPTGSPTGPVLYAGKLIRSSP